MTSWFWCVCPCVNGGARGVLSSPLDRDRADRLVGGRGEGSEMVVTSLSSPVKSIVPSPGACDNLFRRVDIAGLRKSYPSRSDLVLGGRGEGEPEKRLEGEDMELNRRRFAGRSGVRLRL